MEKKKFKIDWTKTMSKIKEQEQSNKGKFKDERIYMPEFRDDGVAQAIIRFLPSKDTDIPFISVYSHSFRGPGGWYIENCPTTLKKECPVCKANSILWDDDQDTVRIRKRKLSYYTNILVIKDPLNPANEGKVYLFKFGKKIYDKIMAKMNPEEGSIEESIMVFDYYEGADFKLMIKKQQVGKDKLPNYDESKFFDKSTAIGDDDVIDKVHNSLYNLKDFVEESNFKDYTELEEKYVRVVGTKVSSSPVNSSTYSEEKASEPKSESKSESKLKEVENSIFDGADDDFLNSLDDAK